MSKSVENLFNQKVKKITYSVFVPEIKIFLDGEETRRNHKVVAGLDMLFDLLFLKIRLNKDDFFYFNNSCAVKMKIQCYQSASEKIYIRLRIKAQDLGRFETTTNIIKSIGALLIVYVMKLHTVSQMDKLAYSRSIMEVLDAI